MSDLSGFWIGNVYGTNNGNIFLELEVTDEHTLKGVLRLNDKTYGLAVFEVEGGGDERLELKLTPISGPPGVELKDGNAVAVLQPSGELSGHWETETGTAGTFVLARHNTLTPIKRAEVLVPEQLFFHRVLVGSVRLFKTDIERLVQVISQDFTSGSVIVTYMDRGIEVTKFVDNFLNDRSNIPLKSMKFSIQEKEPSGFNRSVNVDLVDVGSSMIMTSSTNESWVIGKGEMIKASIKGHENRLVSLYRKYGLWLNNFIFLVLLVVIPGISNWKERAMCVFLVCFVLKMLAEVYNKLVPNTLVFVGETEPGWWESTWPNIVSWMAGIAASVVAGLILWYFTKAS